MFNEFNYESLSFDERESIHKALAETTLKHISQSGGLFEALGFDTAKNPSQQLEVTHLDPVPTDRPQVPALATMASPNLFPCIVETLGKRSALADEIRQRLAKGENIFPVSTHQQMQDIAIWGAAISGELEDAHWQEQNGHIISRGVTTIQAFEMAASEVLQKDGHVFMSFPRTKTIDSLGFDESLIKTNNQRMRSEVDTWLRQDIKHRLLPNHLGRILNIAWSGKTDVISYGDDRSPDSISLGRVGAGTLGIIKRGLVLPLVLWDADEPYCEIGELTQVKHTADAVRVQYWQARSLANFLGLKQEAVTVEQSAQ